MDLAIWNEPPAEFIVSGLASGAVSSPLEVQRAAPRECKRLLDAGLVDVALLPTLSVLRDTEGYDVLPAVALSSWSYPYARLVLKAGLSEPVRHIAFDPQYAQEAFLAHLVLGEHYGARPRFVPYDAPSHEELLSAEEDAALLVGSDVPTLQTEALSLDLGQEWYELANYPMVWGLFATRKGLATPEMIHALREAAEAAEEHRAVWVQAQETLPDLHSFYREDLRVRLDDLAVASLTELRQHLFYYDVLDEVPELPLVALQEEDEDEDDQPLL